MIFVDSECAYNELAPTSNPPADSQLIATGTALTVNTSMDPLYVD